MLLALVLFVTFLHPSIPGFSIEAGDVISIRSPGGGGWGVAPDDS